MTSADHRRAFVLQMLVLAALTAALIVYVAVAPDDWRGAHLLVYGYFALYAVVMTQFTYFLVAYTATP